LIEPPARRSDRCITLLTMKQLGQAPQQAVKGDYRNPFRKLLTTQEGGTGEAFQLRRGVELRMLAKHRRE
jgi:hypothetical protein